MFATGSNLREMVVVVPGDGNDIYRRHQQVWQAMAPYARRGTDFIFTQEQDPQFFRIRSDALPRWAERTVLPSCGRFEIDVVCATGDGYREAVRDCDLVPWVTGKLARQGIDASSVACEQRAWRRGTKRASDADAAERIAVPVARFTGAFSVHNPVLAQEAFRCGIGRGKRFGFGFLRAGA